MKKLAVISANNMLLEKIKTELSDVEVFSTDNINTKEYDLVFLSDFNGELSLDDVSSGKIIRSHLSLLPAFNTSEPIKDAFLGGVKVTGVTVHRVENDDKTGMILAQYPVMIDSFTSYPQLETELKELEMKLVPLVIKSVLEDKVFDIVDFLDSKPAHKCGGCGKCGGCN